MKLITNDIILRREKFDDLHKIVVKFVDDLTKEGYKTNEISKGVEVIVIRSGWLLDEFMGEVDLRGVGVFSLENFKKIIWN